MRGARPAAGLAAALATARSRVGAGPAGTGAGKPSYPGPAAGPVPCSAPPRRRTPQCPGCAPRAVRLGDGAEGAPVVLLIREVGMILPSRPINPKSSCFRCASPSLVFRELGGCPTGLTFRCQRGQKKMLTFSARLANFPSGCALSCRLRLHF